jgi:polysaccharide export outer membrane protein
MGNIEYPHIGLIRAEGLSRLELGDVIKRRLNEKDSVLTDPVVIVRFTNLKVAVLGEVKNPGVITMPGERVTILEALGLAGDISEYGKKDEVVVVRETNGKRDIGKIDLSSDSLFLSPYYQLTQNDIVLVEPSIRKAKRAEEALLLQRVSLGLSVLTAIALLYSIFR